VHPLGGVVSFSLGKPKGQKGEVPCVIIRGSAWRSLCEIIIVVSHLRFGSAGFIFLVKGRSRAVSVSIVSPFLLLC
jgi:hypothetical protein